MLEEDPLQHTEVEDTAPNPACVPESPSFSLYSWTTFAINRNNLSVTKYIVTNQSDCIDGIQCKLCSSQKIKGIVYACMEGRVVLQYQLPP